MPTRAPQEQPIPYKPALVICDEQLLVADGLAQALHGDYDVKAILQSGRALEEMILNSPPDLVITEIDLLHQSGLDAMEHARARGVQVPFIFCTWQTSPALVHRAFYSGARGVVTKLEGVDALRSAVALGLQGKAYLSSSFLPVLMNELEATVLRLTPRQQAILELIAQGLRAQQIADQLGLSRRTIESHKRKLMDMTHTHSPQELLIRARYLGLLGTVCLRPATST